MDASALNGGPISAKGWLNPVCGTIRAGSVSAEENRTIDEDTGTVFPNTATSYVYYTAGPTSRVVDIPPQFVTVGRSSSSVPATAFVPLAQYEFFVSGSFVDATPGTSSSFIIGATFKESTEGFGDNDAFCDAIVSSTQATDTNQMFHVRSVFILTDSGPTSIGGSFSTVSSVNGTANAIVVNNSEFKTVNTPNRVTQLTFSPRLYVQAVGGPVNFTLYNWYLRRIA